MYHNALGGLVKSRVVDSVVKCVIASCVVGRVVNVLLNHVSG